MFKQKKSHKFNDIDLYKIWLNDSNKVCKRLLRDYTGKYTTIVFMHMCDLLRLENEVFFKAMTIYEKYCATMKKENCKLKDPLLVMIVIVFISSKIQGQRISMTLKTAHLYLRKVGFAKYTEKMIKKTEIEVMAKLNYDFPLCTQLDDVETLNAVFLKPLSSSINFNVQCQNILKLVYLNLKLLYNVLSEFYAIRFKSKKRNLLKNFYACQLFVPAGVILCTVKLCNGFKFLNYEDISAKIANYTQIPLADLNIIALLIYKMTNDIIQKHS